MLQYEGELEIGRILVEQYETYKKELPWRETRDPYVIQISEIILQQARVVQEPEYFSRFTERFPDATSLAAAEEDKVLKYQRDLGYYSWVRNLRVVTKSIMEQFSGVSPENYEEVLFLKGIGEYTAAAIISFVWNQPCPVVGGNICRALPRLFAVDTPIDTTKGKRQFAELVGMVLDPKNAGTYNQAIMELGALQCVLQNPDCGVCPLKGKCVAFASGSMQAYPAK